MGRMLVEKKHVYCFFICQIIFLATCGSEEKGTAANEQVMENFLSIFFTTNYGGRYDAFMQTMDGVDAAEDIEAMQECAGAYYAELGAWTEERTLEKIQANRSLYKLEENLMEHGYALTVEDITLTSKEDNIYDFSAELTRTGPDGEAEPITIEGNIRVTGEEENGYLVDYFHVKTDMPYVGIGR